MTKMQGIFLVDGVPSATVAAAGRKFIPNVT
jgi:hypothetical protein